MAPPVTTITGGITDLPTPAPNSTQMPVNPQGPQPNPMQNLISSLMPAMSTPMSILGNAQVRPTPSSYNATPTSTPAQPIFQNGLTSIPLSNYLRPFVHGGGVGGGGGIGALGGYSDGGQLLRGPGTGLSDSIPARIGDQQEARLADGEFVIPADVVSALGGGSTDSGSKKLYAMLDRVRHNAHGSKKQIKKVPDRVLPR